MNEARGLLCHRGAFVSCFRRFKGRRAPFSWAVHVDGGTFSQFPAVKFTFIYLVRANIQVRVGNREDRRSLNALGKATGNFQTAL